MTSTSATAEAILQLRKRRNELMRKSGGPPGDYEGWLRYMFPNHVQRTFGPHHRNFWEWLWDIERGVRPRPYMGVWPRGGGKSTSAELATAAVGCRNKRGYALYVRGTQEQADNSVSNVADLLEKPSVATHYPLVSRRKLSKYGSSRGWRRNRLRTEAGFTVDAMGLDSAFRGAKVEEQRPDFIVFDDIDAKHDTIAITEKKIATLTTSLLPAGSFDVAVMGIQNLIIAHGIFSRMVKGEADFLIDRILSGPFPALQDMVVENLWDAELERTIPTIVSGRPVWNGQGIKECQQFIKTFGFTAFQLEAQHEVFEREGALWKRDMIRHIDECPPLLRCVVGVDPSGGANEIGIIGAGKTLSGQFVVLADETQPGRKGALNWGRAAVNLYDRLQGDQIVAEANFGGDMVESNIQVAAPGRHVNVNLVRASRGKEQRAEPVASLYSDFLAEHVGVFPELESEMTSWVPGETDWSPNRLDAMVWCGHELMLLGSWKERALSGRY